MDIIVKREPADKPSPSTIVSSVLTDLPSKLFRGRTAINYSSQDRVEEVGSIIDLDFVKPGSTSEVVSRGKNSKGMVTAFSLSGAHGNITANISVEIPK